MAEFLEESAGLESTTIGIFRTAATVKGGRRFSFGALVVVGDRRGTVGLGYGKAPGVPAAIEKAQKSARKEMRTLTLAEGTLPHEILGRSGASLVKLVPASPGTGVIAGGTVRAVLEMAGVRDCLTKSYGSNNKKNLAKAAMQGLSSLRTKSRVIEMRGVDIAATEVEEKLEAGRRYAPTATADAPAVRKPQAQQQRTQSGRGRGGGGRGRGRGRQARGQPPEPAANQGAAQAPAVDEAPAQPPAPAEPPSVPSPSDVTSPNGTDNTTKPAD